MPAKERLPRQQALLDLPDPDTRCFEEALQKQGFRLIAGVDEAGRGSLAGPVVAAAVILPVDLRIPGLKDSKQLTAQMRERLFFEISARSIAYAVGVVDAQTIDEINILKASLEAMKQAVLGLKATPDHILIDGPFGIKLNIPQRPIKKGDALSHTISAASVIAKVTRDRMMCKFEKKYPTFRFSVHKGYGTSLHMDELRKYGPTPIHRMTFKGCCIMRSKPKIISVGPILEKENLNGKEGI